MIGETVEWSQVSDPKRYDPIVPIPYRAPPPSLTFEALKECEAKVKEITGYFRERLQGLGTAEWKPNQAMDSLLTKNLRQAEQIGALICERDQLRRENAELQQRLDGVLDSYSAAATASMRHAGRILELERELAVTRLRQAILLDAGVREQDASTAEAFPAAALKHSV